MDKKGYSEASPVCCPDLIRGSLSYSHPDEMKKEKVVRTSQCTAYLQQRRVIEVGEIEQIFTQRYDLQEEPRGDDGQIHNAR